MKNNIIDQLVHDSVDGSIPCRRKGLVRPLREDWNTCQCGRKLDTCTHDGQSAHEIDQQCRNDDGDLTTEVEPALKAVDDFIKVGADDTRKGNVNRTNHVLKHHESSVDSQKWFPLSRRQRTQASLCWVQMEMIVR
jgi:hypothetical protein